MDKVNSEGETLKALNFMPAIRLLKTVGSDKKLGKLGDDLIEQGLLIHYLVCRNKLPHFKMVNVKDYEKFKEEQLERLKKED